LLARQSREPEFDLHKDILNQKGAGGTTLRLPAWRAGLDPLAMFRPVFDLAEGVGSSAFR
jgi:hypothetical protein